MTTLTTADPQVEAARQELSDAIMAFAAVETMAATASTVDVGIAWAAAKARIEAATANLTRAEQAERDRAAAAAARAEAEEKHAKTCTKRAKALQDAEARIVAALTAAQDALTDAFAGVDEYNVILAENVSEMAAQGLAPILDGHPVGADPRARVAFLADRWWRELDASLLVSQLVERLRIVRTDPNCYEVMVRRFSWGNTKNKAAADVLAAVPRPYVAPVERPAYARWTSPRDVNAPVLWASEWAREEAERRRARDNVSRPLQTIPGPDGKPLPFNHHAYKLKSY